MKVLRAFGFVLLALISTFFALATFGSDMPGYFERTPTWLRLFFSIGAFVYLVWWFIADFAVIRSWFRRGRPPRAKDGA